VIIDSNRKQEAPAKAPFFFGFLLIFYRPPPASAGLKALPLPAVATALQAGGQAKSKAARLQRLKRSFSGGHVFRKFLLLLCLTLFYSKVTIRGISLRYFCTKTTEGKDVF